MFFFGALLSETCCPRDISPFLSISPSCPSLKLSRKRPPTADYLIGTSHWWSSTQSSTLYPALHDKALYGVNIPTWHVTSTLGCEFLPLYTDAVWYRVLGVWRHLNEVLSTIPQTFFPSITFPQHLSFISQFHEASASLLHIEIWGILVFRSAGF